MKFVTIVGARPQFVKAATISRAIQEINKESGSHHIEVIVHTGQHYDAKMSDSFFKQMKIPDPDYNLGLGGKTHGEMTGAMITEIEKILMIEKPDALIVYGDTNSTLAGAIAASKLHIQIAHIEAGLRSFNMRMPEEVNRIVTDQLSSWLFCPTETAVRNLEAEGFTSKVVKSRSTQPKIYNVGDVMLDAVMFYRKIAEPSPELLDITTPLESFNLATIHRPSNTDDPSKLESILAALDEISMETPIILPLHPRTRKLATELLRKFHHITVIEPVSYFDILHLLDNCTLVLTDSGGLQKEAYFFNKKCITLREETEWTELVEAKANILVGSCSDKILSACERFKSINLDDCAQNSLYGNGNAAHIIVSKIIDFA